MDIVKNEGGTYLQWDDGTSELDLDTTTGANDLYVEDPAFYGNTYCPDEADNTDISYWLNYPQIAKQLCELEDLKKQHLIYQQDVRQFIEDMKYFLRERLGVEIQ